MEERQCARCDYSNLSLLYVKRSCKIEYDGVGVDLILENSYVSVCPNCRYFNVLIPSPGTNEHFVRAIIGGLAEIPLSLRGSQLHWIGGHMDFEENVHMQDLEFLSDEDDKQVKAAMRDFAAEGRFFSRIEWLDDWYVIFIDLSSTGESVSTNYTENDLEQFNRLFTQVGIQYVSWDEFTELYEEGVTVIDVVNEVDEKIIGVAFCFLDEMEGAVYIDRFVIDHSFISTIVIERLLMCAIVFATRKQAGVVLIEEQKQPQIGVVAISIGFEKIGNFYVMTI